MVSRIAIRDFVIHRICVVSKVTANFGFCILMQTLFKIYFRTRVITSKKRMRTVFAVSLLADAYL